MKKSNHIYGSPSPEEMKMMMTPPTLIKDLDLSHHDSRDYAEIGDEGDKKELEKVINARDRRLHSDDYCHAVDKSVQLPFKALCKEANYPYPEDLMKKLLSDADHYILVLKFHFNRPRPYQAAELLGVPFGGGITPSSKSPAYPSGHSAQARMLATVLGRMYPKIKDRLALTADSVDRTRIELGVHYHTDVKAGQKLGKHMGLAAPLPKTTGLLESSGVDPIDTEEKMKMGFTATIPQELSVTSVLDAVKAIKGITTVRQVGEQVNMRSIKRDKINFFVTSVAGLDSPESLHRKILALQGIITVHIKNVDGMRYARRGREVSESLKKFISQVLTEELTKSDKKEIERISKKVAKKEVVSAINSFIKSDLEKEVKKTLGAKASKEEISKISKNVIKRLYRELSVNYPTIIDRIKV